MEQQILEGAEPPGEESPTKRAVRHEANLQLAAERQNLGLGVAGPE